MGDHLPWGGEGQGGGRVMRSRPPHERVIRLQAPHVKSPTPLTRPPRVLTQPKHVRAHRGSSGRAGAPRRPSGGCQTAAGVQARVGTAHRAEGGARQQPVGQPPCAARCLSGILPKEAPKHTHTPTHPHPKHGDPGYGGGGGVGGSKSKSSSGNHFSSQNADCTRGRTPDTTTWGMLRE